MVTWKRINLQLLNPIRFEMDRGGCWTAFEWEQISINDLMKAWEETVFW